MEYKLSASLQGHEEDVRGVLFPTSQEIISVSRDKTMRIWKAASDNRPNYEARIALISGHWLNAVAYLPPSREYPNGLIFAGGKDLVVEVREPSRMLSEKAEALLPGHSNTICTLDVDPSGSFVVSGAWDNEARVWSVGKWECESILEGHEGSVWAVLAYDPETIITSCADQKIRLYHKSGKLLRSFQASKTPVRALCRLLASHPSGGDFASADNEGVIRFWKLNGNLMGEATGHESFIYSLASLSTGEIVSSGEDRTLRIWKGNICVQTITHPAISIWSVAVCPENGDIVSGASDKIVRVFTRSKNRTADKETLKNFEDSVKNSAISMPDINKEKLPGPDFLSSKSGTKDGQVQMIRESNGSISAYTWSGVTGSWNVVGTVVDSVGSNGQKEVYNDKEYDFVFNVDMEDGKPPLKLPYNLSQNPYDVAADFIKRNEAPITYLDQVANFIIENTRPTTIGETQQVQSTSDPWGSENRYRPGDVDSTVISTVNKSSQKILPQKEYLNITVARLPAIQKKIQELNADLIKSNQKELSLNPVELSVIASLCDNLKLLSTSTISDPEVEVAVKVATKWPYKDRLPGLDLLRLLAIVPTAVTFTYPGEKSLIDILLTGSTQEFPFAENHVMMAIRAFANLFDSIQGRKLALEGFEKIHRLIKTSASVTTNRNLLVAATTVYINFSVYLFNEKSTGYFDLTIAVVDMLSNLLSNQVDSEVIYRALVAMGTLISIDEDVKLAAKDIYSATSVVEKAMNKASDPRIRNVGQEVLDLLKTKS
ncbi:hypothetical protein EPUL_001450 [Erysiphe pulchra]|uniref:PFU-domain-containing protein n=1 Tax=Erysiphe pulchra TaxID=225359 RepID=A0A2S4Q162_9PEZI|nr:hypothetical protein EPUL_001450 [Erysiphe pulchra]